MKKILFCLVWVNLIIGGLIYEKAKPVEVLKEVKVEVPVITEVNTDFSDFKITKASDWTYEMRFDEKWEWKLNVVNKTLVLIKESRV